MKNNEDMDLQNKVYLEDKDNRLLNELHEKHKEKILNEQKLTTQNNEVNELCGCPGSESTWSRRILKEVHEPWCFYFQHLEDKENELSK